MHANHLSTGRVKKDARVGINMCEGIGLGSTCNVGSCPCDSGLLGATTPSTPMPVWWGMGLHTYECGWGAGAAYIVGWGYWCVQKCVCVCVCVRASVCVCARARVKGRMLHGLFQAHQWLTEEGTAPNRIGDGRTYGVACCSPLALWVQLLECGGPRVLALLSEILLSHGVRYLRVCTHMSCCGIHM